ncbi:fungal transcriptional regulatory protein [Teratosphaeria nubilosa]|uniref:Fungal transcriptional regulatory protein n=1 Tax=Teratosphaeria nubilosa TaxID=161662 RepID=A0A6G1KVC2_9PEZI|nr:fungal transcriptional regulatory protein [Teratosphaeria nubilosa]
MDNEFEQIARLAQQASPVYPSLQQEQQPQTQQDPSSNGKRKADDGAGTQPQQRAKRNRYISIACNECKRRKIKCNGQTPCQRCGNLNLECVYAPNCCSGFKDSQEYKDMAAQVETLQEHVSLLYHDLSALRAQLGQPPPPPMQLPVAVTPSAPPQAQMQPAQQQGNSAIDPSLQGYPSHRQSLSMSQTSPGANRRSSQSQNTFRGPTSDQFNFGVAKSSLQTMGITGQEGAEESGNSHINTADPSPDGSPRLRARGQLMQTYHADKDPLWQISQEEAMRLCRVYEDEMGLMYPVLDVNKVVAYAANLYRFMEAAHRSGLMQLGMPGSDAIDDDDTNILKVVLATAMTVEASGRSEMGKRLYEYVQPSIETLTLGNVGIKGIRLLTLAATYEFQRDNEGTSWRIIGLTARLCIELGLHRRETYDAMTDDTERSETILLFWSIYVLDRRWSLGTGMPFALQDADIDPNLPKPEDRSPYLTTMIQYSTIGSKVWRMGTSSSSSPGSNQINIDEMNYLDYQVIQWHRQIPVHLRFEHPSQVGRLSTPIGPPPSRAGHRLRIILYLRANQMRILIYRPVLHSTTSIMQHREQATTVMDVAKDTIRVLTHINSTTDLYRTQQALFNAFLTSALAVLFLAVSHAPAMFAESVREEFYMGLELVRGFSKGSWYGKRLWKTIRVLKEVGPRLGLRTGDGPNSNSQRTDSADMDPSRSAAVAMASLSGHNVEDVNLYHSSSAQLSAGSQSSTSPETIANDLTSLFEAIGGLQGLANGGGGGGVDGLYSIAGNGAGRTAENTNAIQQYEGEDGLSNILRELF